MRSFQRLRRDLEQGLSNRPYTPLYSLLSSLDRYHRGVFSEEALVAELERSHAELSELQASYDQPVLLEALELLESYNEMELDEFQTALEALEPRLLSLDLAAMGSQAERRRHHARLQALMDEPVAEDELILGFYKEIEDRLAAWFEGEAEDLTPFLEGHLARSKAASEDYEGTYVDEQEWTMEVALADELLQHAYQSWTHGLGLLLDSVKSNSPELAEEGLSALLGGNHSFIKVDRLASS
ncbi:MAG: hypothetical protein KC910_09715 [Candidatus Eremiobacteraeota bacterium]|nr:hypothetical protein [Candidatus Eremiobacteraeota bacterium]